MYLWAYDKVNMSDGTYSSTAPFILRKWTKQALPYPAGIFNESETYTATDSIVPYVLHESLYYVLNKIGSFSGINPKLDYSSNGLNATWIPFENFKATFVEILMANFAKLASAVFIGDYMMSQEGVDAYGNPSTDYQRFEDFVQVGTENIPGLDPIPILNRAFTPNLMHDFKKGIIRSKLGEFGGVRSITFKKIGDSDAYYNGSLNISNANGSVSEVSGYLIREDGFVEVDVSIPYDKKNIVLSNGINNVGKEIIIFDSGFPPYTRSSYSTRIYSGSYPFAKKGGYVLAEDTNPEYEISLIGGIAQFVGIPRRNNNGEVIGTQWAHV